MQGAIIPSGLTRVRKLDAAGSVTTYAGSGRCRSNGHDGAALQAKFNQQSGVAIDAGVNVYVTDRDGGHIRRISAEGPISTFVGTGRLGSTGDGRLATLAEIALAGIALDSAGRVYVVQPQERLVRRIDTEGIITAFAGTGERGYGGDGSPTIQARLQEPAGQTVSITVTG